MSNQFVDLIRHLPAYAEQIAHVEALPPRPRRAAKPSAPLHPALAAALAQRGITELYAHQAAALDAARAGDHVGIVTATASGKTLCYQLPTLEAILAEPHSRALFLFPTKALAQDQLRALNGLLAALATNDQRPMTNRDEPQSSFVGGHSSVVVAATLDGDTPHNERARLRAGAQIILSNPDMLHRTVLPNHAQWAGLLGNLRFVVLDEAHIYRGVFGTHAALVLRRLRRLCAHYGSAPQFICCSATSANPQGHLAALVGEPVQVIDGDGAPQGARSFVFWNPPVRDQASGGQGSGRTHESAPNR